MFGKGKQWMQLCIKEEIFCLNINIMSTFDKFGVIIVEW